MAEYNFTKKAGQPSLVNEGVYLVNAGRTDTANNELNGLGTYVADLERFSLGNWNSIVRNDPVFMSKLSAFTEYIENGRPVNVHYEPQAVLIYAIMEQYGQINTMIGDNGLIGDGNTGTAFDYFTSSTGIDDSDTHGMTTAQYYEGLYGGAYLPAEFLQEGSIGGTNYTWGGPLSGSIVFEEPAYGDSGAQRVRVKDDFRISYDLGEAYIEERTDDDVKIKLSGNQVERMNEILEWEMDLQMLGGSGITNHWIRYKFKVKGGDESTIPYMKLKLPPEGREELDNTVETPPLGFDSNTFTVNTNTIETNIGTSLYHQNSGITGWPDFESGDANSYFGWPNFTANVTTDLSLPSTLTLPSIDFQVFCIYNPGAYYTGPDSIPRSELYGDDKKSVNNFLYHNEDADFDAFFNSSYPIKVHLGIDLFGQNASLVEQGDDFSNNSSLIGSVYPLIDVLFSEGETSVLTGILNAEHLQALNNVYYYEVIQWGDEDVLLSDDDILNSEYFAIYEQEDFSSDNFISKRNTIVQTQNTKKIVESQPIKNLKLSNHIYSTPGVKSIKIIVFRYTEDLTFLLETILVTKNIVINDGAVLSQDFEIYGGTDFTFLPLKGHETIIGGIDKKSKYNISAEKIAKDDIYDEQDYLGKKANNKFIEQFRNGYFGKQPDKIDLSVTRVFKGASDIYSMLTTPEHTQHIVDAEFPTFSDSFFSENIHLEDNSVVTDIFINDSENDTLKEKCMIEISPEKIEFLSIENSVGNKGQGVLIGDYEVKKEKNQPIQKQGLMQTPMIEQNSEKQAF